MTSDQKHGVILYSVVSVISFAIVGALTLNSVAGDFIRDVIGWKSADIDSEIDKRTAEFKTLAGLPLYIPYASRFEVVDQIICAPLSKVTEGFLPESIVDGKELNESIITSDDFPNLRTDADIEVSYRKALLS